MAQCIVMTGGGTAGHVTPNLALIEYLNEKGSYKFVYIGSQHGIEATITQGKVDCYHAIITGKLRRSRSIKNLFTPFQVLLGTLQAAYHLYKHKPSLIFSKGGFVSVPVVLAGKILNIPVIIHESDRTPGLANRLVFPFASEILTTFEETSIPKKYTAKHTGTPIRPSLLETPPKILNLLKPNLLVVGGSQGSKAINSLIWDHLDYLISKANIVHICGSQHILQNHEDSDHYKLIGYANESMSNLIQQADIIISRAGANSICEWLHLCKPHLLIPLPASHSRGDQIENADYFAQKGVSLVYREESMQPEQFLKHVEQLINERHKLHENLTDFAWPNGTKTIGDLLLTKLSISTSNKPSQAQTT